MTLEGRPAGARGGDVAPTPGGAEPIGGSAPMPAGEDAASATRRQLRGSSLLLAGRLVAMVVNFAVQVIIVRYLAVGAFGAFAYALALATFVQTLVTAGLDNGFTRFLAIYDERRDAARLAGTVVFVVGTILGLSTAAILLFAGLRGAMTGTLIDDPTAVALLAILIFLAPIQALDDVLTGLFAVFASPRSIFIRKYLLGPGLRLVVVVLLVLAQAGVEFLAAGYVLAGLAGILVYLGFLVGLLRRRRIFAGLRPRAVRIPAREILAFTIPLLTTDLVYLVMNTTDALVLGAAHGADAVAAFRVVQPAAGLNQLVFTSFALLYMPLASRLFARGDRGAVRDLYWRTASWIAILSFPLFALTFSLAEPLTIALYEPRYADSAVYLALLSLGQYVNVALGFNGLTLRVYGVVRLIVGINLVAAALNLVLILVLIPPFGPLGAAVGTFLALVAHNVLKQAALRAATGVGLFDRHYLRVYLVVAVVAAALLAVQAAVRPPFAVGLGLVALAGLVVVAANRDVLRVGETFPELLRLPLARRIFRP